MSRFQALTNPVLEAELDLIREELGLRENQKAELLRELSSVASWVIHQRRAGRAVLAQSPDGQTEPLPHPLAQTTRIVLTEAEANALAKMMEGGTLPDALRGRIRELTQRPPPALTWREEAR